MDTNYFSAQRGYLLQEVMVGLIIFGIAMLPILRALILLPRIAASISLQGRAESGRSASDQLASFGIDPTVMPVLDQVGSPEDPLSLTGRTVRTALPSRMGAAQIDFLTATFDSTPEERTSAAGIEISAGSISLPPRTDPLPPLPPIRIASPVMSPASGTFVNVLALSPPSSAGAPSFTEFVAQGGTADSVHLRQSLPRSETISGVGTVRLRADAAELAESVQGSAWSEYAGNQKSDTAIVLDDGRTRWLVKIGAQIQVYEPSDPVAFVYGVDLGRPLYRIDGTEYNSGETITIDYALARHVEGGTGDAVISYSADVRARFGDAWPTVEPSFAWTFGNFPGDSSGGNTQSLYTQSGRIHWQDSQILSASAITRLAGLRAFAGTWTLQRLTTVLGPPERTSPFYDAAVDEPGLVDFSAPNFSGGGEKIGRPEINGVESVSSVLSVPLVP